MRLIVFIMFFVFLFIPSTWAEEYLYILNDNCIKTLYTNAVEHFENSEVIVIRDPHGIILRFELKNPVDEFASLSTKTNKNLNIIKNFLAKIHNPVIIEVHITEMAESKFKKWEISAVIANKIEETLLKSCGSLTRDRVHSVGFGEFSPSKNTPYNGGNYSNRVDIIILCDVNGE